MSRPEAPDLADEILRTAQAMLRAGLVTGSLGNVSAREGELIVITPSGLPYPEMTERDLVTLALADGRVVRGELEPSSERRVHLAIYATRPDVGAIVHTHSHAATAWSARGEPLDAGGPVRTAPFAESGSDELAVAVVEALGGDRAVLMERHGVVGVGATPSEALAVCAEVERAASAAVDPPASS